MILSLWHLEYRWFTGNWAHIIIFENKQTYPLQRYPHLPKENINVWLYFPCDVMFFKAPPKNKPTPTKYRDLTNENPPSSAFPFDRVTKIWTPKRVQPRGRFLTSSDAGGRWCAVSNFLNHESNFVLQVPHPPPKTIKCIDMWGLACLFVIVAICFKVACLKSRVCCLILVDFLIAAWNEPEKESMLYQCSVLKLIYLSLWVV